MRYIIIAPHPDDEWIGCGCTLQKLIAIGQKVIVLIITRVPRTERRISVSNHLSKKYGYKVHILGEPELKINEFRLAEFLKKSIKDKDMVYIPDSDNHPDHQKINRIAKKILNNNIYEYAVYNNSRKIFIRLKNKLIAILTRKSTSSFKHGGQRKIFQYNLRTKNYYITNLFLEKARGGDVTRCISQQKQ